LAGGEGEALAAAGTFRPLAGLLGPEAKSPLAFWTIVVVDLFLKRAARAQEINTAEEHGGNNYSQNDPEGWCHRNDCLVPQGRVQCK
jgi:hypothetical protein